MFRMISKSYFAIALLAALAASASAADFDRDGKADFAVFRPSSTTWLSEPSGGDAKATAFQWGHASDVLVPADYDSDGVTDFATWRPENGVWYIHQSGDDSALLVRWGTTTVHPTVVRAVTHLDVTDDDIDTAVAAIALSLQSGLELSGSGSADQRGRTRG